MARVTWSTQKSMFLKTWLDRFYAMPQASVSSQFVKTALCLSFYHRKVQRIQDHRASFAFYADLPRDRRGAMYHDHPLRVSCHLRAAPVPSAWWPVMQAASFEGWDVCPCLLFLQTQSGPERLETLVFYVPLAPYCLLPARRVHRLLFLSVTNAPINLETLLLDHSNILFKIIIWKITWQRTLLLFLLWKGARFTKGPQAGLW